MEENTVELNVVDDAPAVDEVSIEQLAQNLSAEETDEEATGAVDQPAQEETQQPQQEDKFGNRIKAALASQRTQIFKDLGMSEAEVRELILEKRAADMSAKDKDISPKAARRIIEAESATLESRQMDALRAGIQELIDSGWTEAELKEFSQDSSVQANIQGGMTVRQAARAYLHGQQAPEQKPRKRAVPTSRATAAGPEPEGDLFGDMSDAEFDRLRARVKAAAMSGKTVRI